MRVSPIVLALVTIAFLGACRETVDVSLLEKYTGPVSIAYNIELVHSDSAIVRTHLRAKKQLKFDDGSFEFPEGIEIDFFDKNGKVTTTMRADRGFFENNKNLYRGEGDVRVENLEKDQSLASELLFWDPNAKKIYTDKFVTVREKETVFNGTGMEADEGFNEYKMYKVTNSRTILPGEGI